MEYSNGYLLIPHKAGWIRWRPGAWEFVGPEQEGAFEGGISAVFGFGPTEQIAFTPVGCVTHWSQGLLSQRQHHRGQIEARVALQG